MNVKNLDNLCMNCFSPMPAGAAFCTVCGHDQKSPPDAEYRLPLRTILNGKYMVGQVLGEGGFGITYVGYDLNLDIRVAVKEYYPSGFVTRTATNSSTVQTFGGEQGEIFRRGRERFVDEAKRLARFRTLRGIVMVNDFFVENGTAYIVMEFVEGVTLKSYMAQMGGKLPADKVLDMLAPVFSSLAEVHQSGIIHRDISPDNIMITPDGSVKLLDFGAAREFGIDERSLSVMLKHGYAPMEQYSTRGQQGPHTDVYALCATIYKAITGVTPESAMDRVIEDVVQPPRLLGVSIAPHQEAALMKGLAVRAEHRWQTVGELQAALGIVGATVPGRPPAQTPPAPAAPQPPPPPSDPHHGRPGTVAPTPPTKTPAKSKTPKIVAAIISACVVVVVAIALALTLPGTQSGGEPAGGGSGDGQAAMMGSPDADTTPDANPALADSPAPTPEQAINPEPTPDAPPEDGGAVAQTANVVAVGSDYFGELQVSDWTDIAQISAGYGHTVGLRSDGTVVAIGDRRPGKCNVSDWRGIAQISAGTNHTVGLRSDGTVVAVGMNDWSECDLSAWRDIAQVSAGNYFTVGIRSDGTVVAVGDNNGGQCNVSAWRGIIAVSTGTSHTVGLKSDGTVVAVGWNMYGQCDVSTWRDIVAVSAAGLHTVGLRSDGTVVAVGANFDDQCDVSAWRDIVAVSAGGAHTVGLRSDGTVVAVGYNYEGECDVSDWRGIAAVSAGHRHTVAILADPSTG